MKITGETGDSFCGLMGVEGEEEEGEEEGIKSEPSLSLVVTELEGGRGSLDTGPFRSTATMRTCSTSIIEQ